VGLFASMGGSRVVVWMDGGIYWLGSVGLGSKRGMGILNAHEETDDTG
jgi:hypothetical protein